VRSIFSRVVSERPQDKETAAPQLGFFQDQQSASKSIAQLGQGRGSFHVAPRTRQIFQKLQPMLLEQLARSVDPMPR
jgi:glutamine synthetase adenylyltransferase